MFKLLYVSSPDCPACRANSVIINQFASLHNIEVITYNPDTDNWKTAEKLGITGIPHTTLVKKDSTGKQHLASHSGIWSVSFHKLLTSLVSS